MIKNRTLRTIILSTILALLTVGFLALSVSAHTAAPTRVSSSSVTVHPISISGARRRHVPVSYIYYDPYGYPYYYPSYIHCRPSRSLSFIISNQTNNTEYITSNGQIIASIGAYSNLGFYVTGSGYYYLGLYYSSYTLTVYAH